MCLKEKNLFFLLFLFTFIIFSFDAEDCEAEDSEGEDVNGNEDDSEEGNAFYFLLFTYFCLYHSHFWKNNFSHPLFKWYFFLTFIGSSEEEDDANDTDIGLQAVYSDNLDELYDESDYEVGEEEEEDDEEEEEDESLDDSQNGGIKKKPSNHVILHVALLLLKSQLNIHFYVSGHTRGKKRKLEDESENN